MTNYRETTAALLALAGVGGILVSAAAVAQEVEIEEVLVTARKKAEDLQETPLAISAFTAKQIEEQGISSIDDVALRTPGSPSFPPLGVKTSFGQLFAGNPIFWVMRTPHSLLTECS
ncbi:MAG: TonB-dependent receptor [Proteobacteria bacterium]|nr:TonB-dependent receptor [Pseudomonadota bacterium]